MKVRKLISLIKNEQNKTNHEIGKSYTTRHRITPDLATSDYHSLLLR